MKEGRKEARKSVSEFYPNFFVPNIALYMFDYVRMLALL
jgi:hypothetical protein